MTATLWDTTGGEIVRTLGAERRAAGALASGLALTLVAVADEADVEAAQEAATTAAAAHPCRLLVVVRRRLEADDRLDAEVEVGGRLGANEAVVMRMYGRLTLHAESVVLPLLAPDAPVVTWWHGPAPDRLAHDPLGVLASRRVTDAAAADDPLKELRQRARDYAPGDTDLAWTRATPWRALLASAFDAVRATFPAGTVSGAPKVRAMEIIDELEPVRRGPYAGAVGYFAYGARSMDTAIAIRTLVAANGLAHVQAGAGIVADSDPGREYEETLAKARALLAVLGRV